MRHHAELFFPLSPTLAQAVAAALAPEASQSEVPKTRGAATAEQDGLRIALDAEDLASLRATVNSHLRWVDAALKVARIGQGER